jgi:hypothetical protein
LIACKAIKQSVRIVVDKEELTMDFFHELFLYGMIQERRQPVVISTHIA